MNKTPIMGVRAGVARVLSTPVLCCASRVLPGRLSLSLARRYCRAAGHRPPTPLLPSLSLLLVAAVMALAVNSTEVAGSAGVSGAVPELSSGAKSRPAAISAAVAAVTVVNHEAGSGEDLVSLLKDERLWDAHELEEVPPVLIRAFPADIAAMGVEEKKRAFIHSLLPVVMVAMDEVRGERRELLAVLDRLGDRVADVYFDPADPVWRENVTGAQERFILALCAKYRTRSAAELLRRVDVLPASLVIAQAAMESSWGGSRFASQANNLFGMWTWGDKGLVPNRRDPGKTHKIAVYDSILDSVRAYLLTINRVPAYARLRDIRTRTHDPLRLSEGLVHYSEKGEFYVADIKKIIRYNNLTGYDKLRLAAG